MTLPLPEIGLAPYSMTECLESQEKRNTLLEGTEILDLADEKGSFCSKLLADLGARVIKIERPGGDPARAIGPFSKSLPHAERSLSFYYANANKLGITLNLEREEGREIFLKLLKKTDVVVETFPPEHLKNLGLDVDLRKVNPKLIWASITGFGKKGPRSGYKSCDLVASAYGGQMYVTGSPSGPPLKVFGEQSYLSASLFAAVAILLALRKRDRSGKGEQLDISLQESVTSTLDHVMIRYFYEQTIAKREGNAYWNHAFYIFPCKDGHLLLEPFQQWETLVEWMEGEGMEEDLKDEVYRNLEYRLAHIDHILRVIERWTRTHTKAELFESGQLMRFPWAPVCSLKEVLKSPQLKARGFFAAFDGSEITTLPSFPGSPHRFSLCRPPRFKRSPLIGEDNVRIYQEELGFSEEECRTLSSLNVI